MSKTCIIGVLLGEPEYYFEKQVDGCDCPYIVMLNDRIRMGVGAFSQRREHMDGVYGN